MHDFLLNFILNDEIMKKKLIILDINNSEIKNLLDRYF